MKTKHASTVWESLKARVKPEEPRSYAGLGTALGLAAGAGVGGYMGRKGLSPAIKDLLMASANSAGPEVAIARRALHGLPAEEALNAFQGGSKPGVISQFIDDAVINALRMNPDRMRELQELHLIGKGIDVGSTGVGVLGGGAAGALLGGVTGKSVKQSSLKLAMGWGDAAQVGASLLIPGAATALSANDARKAFQSGRWMSGLGHAGLAAVGLVPGFGGIANKALGAGAKMFSKAAPTFSRMAAPAGQKMMQAGSGAMNAVRGAPGISHTINSKPVQWMAANPKTTMTGYAGTQVFDAAREAGRKAVTEGHYDTLKSLPIQPPTFNPASIGRSNNYA